MQKTFIFYQITLDLLYETLLTVLTKLEAPSDPLSSLYLSRMVEPSAMTPLNIIFVHRNIPKIKKNRQKMTLLLPNVVQRSMKHKLGNMRWNALHTNHWLYLFLEENLRTNQPEAAEEGSSWTKVSILYKIILEKHNYSVLSVL